MQLQWYTAAFKTGATCFDTSSRYPICCKKKPCPCFDTSSRYPICCENSNCSCKCIVQIAAVSALYLNHLLATFSLSFLLVSVLLIFRVKNLLQDIYNLSSPRSTTPSVGEGGYSDYRPQTPGAKKISESALYLNSLPSRLPPSLPPFSSPSLPHSPSLPLSLPRDYSGYSGYSPQSPGETTLRLQASSLLGDVSMSGSPWTSGPTTSRSQTSSLFGGVMSEPPRTLLSYDNVCVSSRLRDSSLFFDVSMSGSPSTPGATTSRSETSSVFGGVSISVPPPTLLSYDNVSVSSKTSDLLGALGKASDNVEARAYAEAKRAAASSRQQGSEPTPRFAPARNVSTSVLRNFLDQRPVADLEFSSPPPATSAHTGARAPPAPRILTNKPQR